MDDFIDIIRATAAILFILVTGAIFYRFMWNISGIILDKLSHTINAIKSSFHK